MTVWSLWLPILATGIATHVWSTLAWTVLPHHKPDWQKIPMEEEMIDWLSVRNLPAGQYLFPFTADGSPKKRDTKCLGMLVLWPNAVSMGAAIGKTLAFFLVAAFVIGYLASIGLGTETPRFKVFQFVTTAGLLAHCAGIFPGVFWFQQKIALDLVDKAIYALLTGLIFAWLWPVVS